MTDHHQAWIKQIVLTYEGRLIAYALRIVGDLSAARDVVQETFLKLCKTSRDGIADHVQAWLYTACRCSAIDWRRRNRAMTHATLNHFDAASSTDTDPAMHVEQADSAREIRQLVDTLPANQREVITLKFSHGLSYKDIAGVMGISVGNVGFLIHTAIKSLRSRVAV